MKYYTVNVNVRHTFPNATAAFSSFYCYPYPYHIVVLAIAFTEFPINPTSLSLSLDPRHDMSSSGLNPSPLRRGGMKDIALPILFIPPQIVIL